MLVVASTAVLLVPAPAEAQSTTFRLGASITVAPGERVEADLMAIGGTIDVLGEVDGDVVAIGGAIELDGTVRGDVVAIGGNIRLGANARVLGDVSVVGGAVLRDPSAVVSGEVTIVNAADGLRFNVDWFPFVWSPWMDLPLTLLYVAGLLALALLVTAAVPNNVQAVASHMETQVGRSMVIGLLALLLLVPLTLLLALTIIGPPLLWLGFVVAKLLGYVALVSLVGRWVAERLSGSPSPIGQVAIGVGIVALVRYIPILGPLFSLVVTVWSLGAVLDTKFGTNRPWLPPQSPGHAPAGHAAAGNEPAGHGPVAPQPALPSPAPHDEGQPPQQ